MNFIFDFLNVKERLLGFIEKMTVYQRNWVHFERYIFSRQNHVIPTIL